MFINIFLNIKLLLKNVYKYFFKYQTTFKKRKTKNSFVSFISNYAHFIQNYMFLTKMHKLNKRKFKFQHQTISFLTIFKYIYYA